MSVFKKVFLFSLLVGFSLRVGAWGQTGHRAIAQIAIQHLDKKTKKELFKIMGHESLVEASTWMDEIRSDSTWDHTRTWHYVTIPDGETYADTDKEEKGDVVEAIERMKAILKDDSKNKEEKRNAVAMLVHMIGDIHQPLHVGNGTDKGGNDVKIKWFYDKSNLHRIWDSEMIDSKQYSYSELAKLVDHPHDVAIGNLDNTDISIWLSEAVALRPQVYKLTNEEYLSYEYMYENWHTVEEQIEKAGRRLASVLNEVLGS